MKANIGVILVSDRYGTFPRQSIPFNSSLSSDICSESSGEINPFVYIIHSKDMKSMPSRVLSFAKDIEFFSRKFEKTYFVISAGYSEVVNGIDKAWVWKYLSDIHRVADFFQFEVIIVNPKVSSKMTKPMKDNLSSLHFGIDKFASRELVDKIDVDVRFLDGNLSNKSANQLSKKITDYIVCDMGVKKKPNQKQESKPKESTGRIKGKRIIVGAARRVEPEELNIETTSKPVPTNGFKRPILKQKQKEPAKVKNKRRRKISKSPEVIIFGR